MKDSKISDVALVDEFKAGRVDAFEEIIARYETKVMNLALRFTRNQEDAEEVMQDVFTTVYRVTHELQEVLQRAIDKLPDQYRAVFVLRDVDGLSNQETGRILDLSIPAVKSRLHRSRIMLRKKLQRYYEDFTGNKAIIEENSDELSGDVAA